ncbi:MAG: serine/threonine protein kinase [Phycisphaeraceae bacterium]|nr:MAG: serine/threonine protein kinase [Phycisphaeraceae bacterium]
MGDHDHPTHGGDGSLESGSPTIDRLFPLDSVDWAERVMAAMADDPECGRLGEYELLEEIGRGGQGEVYKALQPRTGRVVALKRIAGIGLAPSETLRNLFAREVEALIRLSHPNVVGVYAAEVIDGHTLLVMEYVDGVPIDQWADECWSADEDALRRVLEAFACVCDGVMHAHARGVIHRDIKPGNVLVDATGTPKVLDFGIAKIIDEHHPEATVSGFLGTPGYAAPERARSGAVRTDTRSDVYSMGVLLFRMLTGREAFEGKERASSESGMRIPAPSRYRTLPRECDWIVETATREEPDRRYQTVEALRADIRALLRGDAVAAAPASATYRFKKAVSRYRYAVAGSGVVFASLVIATIVSVASAERARDALRESESNRLALELALENERSALEASHASEERALLEAARQQQISRLMRKVLGGSAQIVSARPNITVREALDRAVAEEFTDPERRSRNLDPLVEATLREAIADTYLGIGLHEQGVMHMRIAAELFRETRGIESDEYLAALNLLGSTLRAQGRLAEAETVLRETVDALRVRGASHVISLANALSSLGVSLRRQGKLDEALETYLESLALYDASQGPEGESSARLRLNIAIVLSHLGEHEEAIALLRRTLVDFERLNPEGSLDLCNGTNALGNMLWEIGEREEGEKLIRRSIELFKALYGGPAAATAWCMTTLAARLGGDGRNEEAIELGVEAMSIHDALSNHTSGAALQCRAHLAGYYRVAGRLSEAETVAGWALERELPRIAESSMLLRELGEIYVATERFEDAERVFLLAWEMLVDDLPVTVRLRESLAKRLSEFYEDNYGSTDASEHWRGIATGAVHMNQ